MKIKVIFTGGTISSQITEQGISVDNNNKANKLLINSFYEKTKLYDVLFEISEPFSVLSENMTIAAWNVLLKELRETDFNKFDGIIIAHGTDTLAYTANMLSIMLGGINIPVMLVSSNYVLADKKANGTDNFINSVYFISKKKYAGVYAIYKNDNGGDIIYSGSEIKQCENLTNRFSSKLNVDFGEIIGNKICVNADKPLKANILGDNSKELLLYKIKDLKPCVLIVYPYTGLDYNNINLTKNIKAVLHYLYHGGTASTASQQGCSSSILDFNKKCTENKVELFVSPLEKGVLYNYTTTKQILDAGIKALYDISEENAYTRLLIAYSCEDENLRCKIINNSVFLWGF